MTVPPRNRLGAVLAMLAAGCAIARAQGPEIALPTAERTALIAELQAGSFRLLTTPDEAAIGPVVDLLITAREV
ncbi:MAG: hypothetical protein KDE27_08375, partial [Planctomycetes bacterium]|nr:hypothetical protein [Planctomycetota bacterium]